MLLISGCATGAAPENAPGAVEASAQASDPGAASYGDLVGTGEVVTDVHGEYEKVALSPDAAVATWNPEIVGDGFFMKNFTEDQLVAAQVDAMDFVVTQFIDSSALDTGLAGYQDWLATTAPQYLSAEITGHPANATGETLPVLNTASVPNLPVLIRDGAPRANNLELNLSAITADAYNDVPYIDFSIQYVADYRVSDAEATAFAAQMTAMSESDFLASDRAKPQLADGTGVNLYGVSGSLRVGLEPTGDGFTMVGLQSTADFDTSDFTGS